MKTDIASLSCIQGWDLNRRDTFKSCKWSYPSPAVVAPDYYAAAGSGVNILSATLGNFVVDDRLKDGGIRLSS
jgi:hypothetical protein